MGDEINEADGVAVTGRHRDVPAETVLERVGQRHGSVGDQARQRRAGKDLGDRADPHHRLAVGLLVDVVGDLAEAHHGGVAVPDHAEDKAGDAAVEVENRAGQLDRLMEQRIVCRTRGQRQRG